MRDIITMLCMLLALFYINSVAGQEKRTFSGTLKDSQSKETLLFATIDLGNGYAVNTNEYGFFSISVPPGSYPVTVSYVGYQTLHFEVNLNRDVVQTIELARAEEVLQEVVIQNHRLATQLKRPEMSIAKMDAATIKKTPVVFGEVDVLKAILQLPGITNSGEGSSGFHVRGGSVDQNLVLLDEATLYNSSHLFGFFSVLNNDAVKDIKLYKGAIPARFGGRVSSVMDIYQKEGNAESFHLNGGIGVISSRLLAEGPIVRGKSSFLLGGRASYAHLFMNMSDTKNSAYFYDLNTKVSHRFNEANTLYASGYFGRDYFAIGDDFKNTYGNALLNLRWNHLFSDRLFSNLSVNYSDYYYGLEIPMAAFAWQSGISNLNVKYDFKYYATEQFKFNFGINKINYRFDPGEIKPTTEDSGVNYKQLQKKNATEVAAYFDTEQKLTNRLQLHYGFRLSYFQRFGKQTVNTYQDNLAVLYDAVYDIYYKATPIGTKIYGRHEKIIDFFNWEPRAALSYTWGEQAVKLGYNRMAQYVHLLSNTLTPTPLDIWTPSDRFIKPQLADQFTLGYYTTLKEERYSVEVEAYFKQVKNRMNYIDGADLIANEAIEQVLLNGEERAYGVEFLGRKNTGKLTGWLSYTLSKAEQRTPGRTPLEPGINNGKWYNANHDRTHNLAVTANYELSRRWSLGSNFTFQTGRATTQPNGYYEYLGINVPSYEARNAARLPHYHRLDLAATYTPKPDSKKRFTSEWVFSIYNVYNQMNANSINFRQNADTGVNESIQLSIFGMVPSVTYNFKF
ncbi:TonB-dependent receptor [Flavobacterium sedimenticola]|uniref:isocitrate dehydrogenase (NADP(+)) n=1 Tax=Flavobacterium sedimenticola TaxID=3043286 RepID=A0ABT6XST0_9FLAO|nr:TonB-dependent receptor [Flavobacterium sedimenticola]MDI9258162.1 TonB-dependent receptor [Flavobacterium sedimenticola]